MQLHLTQYYAEFTAWGRRGGHLLRRLASHPQAGEMVGFALRNWLTSMLAFYLACAWQLDSPHWAWVTVWIVAQTTPGRVLSKSLYRVIGTLAGCAWAIVLIALFAQTPEFFVLALAALVGVCTYFSQMLTNFRAYATVLAAYTAGIVAADAINAPDRVFYIAMARGSCILIGIGCSVVITSLFAPHRAKEETLAQLQDLLKKAAQRAVFSWRGDHDTRIKMGRQLISDCIQLDSLVEFAAAESGEFRIHASTARSLIAHIFGMISARRELDAHLSRRGWPRHHLLNVYHEVIIDFLREMPDKLDRQEVEDLLLQLQEILAELKNLRPEEETLSCLELVSERFVIDVLQNLLLHLQGALTDWRDILHGNGNPQPRLTLNFHRDLRAARINGLRAFVAVCGTGTFWIGSAWPDGPGALIFVCVLMSLFSSQPHPDRVGWRFFQVGIVAALIALFCKFFVLPSVTDYEFLTLSLGLFLIPMGLFMAHPPTTAAATSFSLVFLNTVQPGNPMSYDLAGSINSVLALLSGILFGTLAYVLIFPPDPQAARRYVTYRIQLGLELLARLQPIPPTSNWETRMYDRVMRLNDPENLSSTPTDEWLNAGLGALTLGNEILRLRHGLSEEKMSPTLRTSIENVINAFSRFLNQPQKAEKEVQFQVQALSELDPGRGQTHRCIWARTLGTLIEIELYLADHPRLLNKK